MERNSHKMLTIIPVAVLLSLVRVGLLVFGERKIEM